MTAPRLVRIDWPGTCSTTPSGFQRCDLWNSGPVLKFDEPVDCASLPHVANGVIRSPGAVKVYEKRIAAFKIQVLDFNAMTYGLVHEGVSIPVETVECSGNQARVRPVTGAFPPGNYVVFVTERVRDQAGNALVNGVAGWSEAVGDVRDWTSLQALATGGVAYHGEVSTAFEQGTGSVRPYWADAQDTVEIANWRYHWGILQPDHSAGATRRMVFSQELDCDAIGKAHVTRAPIRFESAGWDAYRSGQALVPDTAKLSCHPTSKRLLQFDEALRAGHLYRMTLDGSIGSADGSMTMGFGRYRSLNQEVSGGVIPVPRDFPIFIPVNPTNLYQPPQCEELTVTEPVTHFDRGWMSPSCQAVSVYGAPMTTGPTVYSIANRQGFVARGACVQYTGPAWQDDQNLASKCESSFAGGPSEFANQGPRFSQYETCDIMLPQLGDPNGVSFLETGVVGICIVNPGKANESVVYHFDYDKRTQAKAACSGLWRERGAGYALGGATPSAPLPAPGVNREVARAVCPDSDGNVGDGATTKPPTGQTCPSRSIELDTTGGRWFRTAERSIAHPTQAGKFTKVSGIHTYWANEPLKIRIKNNCQEGYYKLTFKGMNVDGPLPSFYGGFALALRNETGVEDKGAMVLAASDQLYSQSSVVVYLEEGDTTFDLRWQNDAYKPGQYDANLHLGSVTMAYQAAYKPPTKLGRGVREACAIRGRFFYKDKTAWTSWANQQLGFCYKNLPSGKYAVSVQARNHGVLPPGYAAFEVAVAADGVAGSVSIPASADTIKTGKTTLDLRGGDISLLLSWTNDQYVSDDVDAAIEIQSIALKRVGDSERSVLTAFLAAPSKRSWQLWALACGAALLSVVGVLFLRWRARALD